MDIVNILISLVSGGVGGNAAGAALKDQSLGTIGNTIAGVVGGGLGSFILQALGVLSTMGMTDMSIGSIIGNVAGSGIGGAVLMAIVGFIKNAVSKKT